MQVRDCRQHYLPRGTWGAAKRDGCDKLAELQPPTPTRLATTQLYEQDLKCTRVQYTLKDDHTVAVNYTGYKRRFSAG